MWSLTGLSGTKKAGLFLFGWRNVPLLYLTLYLADDEDICMDDQRIPLGMTVLMQMSSLNN